MAVLARLPSSRIIDGFKGKIDFYVYMGLSCARKWPKKTTKTRTPEVQAQWPIFQQAVALWDEISSVVKQAYEEMALHTNLTARDMFIRGYISGNLRFYYLPDELSDINE